MKAFVPVILLLASFASVHADADADRRAGLLANAMNMAGSAQSQLVDTAAAMKGVTNSDAYKKLQSVGIDPMAMAATALKNQPGPIGIASSMMMSAANGDSMQDIAKAGIKGALGPLGGVAGYVMGDRPSDKNGGNNGQGIFTPVGMIKTGYGLISGKELDDAQAGYIQTAANMAAKLG